MIGVIAWAVAIVLSAGIVGWLRFELNGHRRRLRRAVIEAWADLEPKLTAFGQLGGASGRHRADTVE